MTEQIVLITRSVLSTIRCSIVDYYFFLLHFKFIYSPDCVHGDVRLSYTSNPLHGLVELCYDGVWGTVCSTSWYEADAQVVCRQLGYSSAGKYLTVDPEPKQWSSIAKLCL